MEESVKCSNSLWGDSTTTHLEVTMTVGVMCISLHLGASLIHPLGILQLCPTRQKVAAFLRTTVTCIISFLPLTEW